jgi:hypothetical protein
MQNNELQGELDKVYEADEKLLHCQAVDILFDLFDDLHLEGRFEESDALLESVDVDRLSTTLLVGVLSITHTARYHLPNRSKVVRKIEDRLTLLAPDRVESLIKNLRD